MDVQLEQLRSFVEIAETRHFTRAAERLHIAQPTLSRQLSTLESDVGLPLVHRVRGNVSLTPAGERLLPVARRMLADAENVRTELAEIAGLRGGRIRIGATPTLCASLVADVLAEFHPRHPGVDIEILESGSRALIAALAEGSLDVALVVTSVAPDQAARALTLEPLLREGLVVVSAAARPDPFDGADSVTLRQLATVPQLSFSKSYDLRVALDAAFSAENLEPTIAVDGVEMDAAVRFAERGIGVAVVPALVATQHPALRAIPLADTSLTRTVSIARHSDMHPAPASAAMLALIRSVADRLAAPESQTGPYVERASISDSGSSAR